jgi:NADH-quinone oxidoreductase subunit E
MIPDELAKDLQKKIAGAEHPREMAIDVMVALQNHYGYLTDDAVLETAELVDMTPLEVEELATFYDFIFRQPVGKYVIHVCDGVVCWMNGHQRIIDYLSAKLGIRVGETTPDGLFTLLPVCCIGYCDRSPAMLVNRLPYGPLSPERIDRILQHLRARAEKSKAERV